MPGRTALIADDELPVRRYLRALLDREGFEILEADNGVDALQLLREHGSRIRVIVTDIKMPRGDGLTFARSAQRLYPEVPIILISGYYVTHKAERASTEFEFIEKPFQSGALLEMIRKLVSGSSDSGG